MKNIVLALVLGLLVASPASAQWLGEPSAPAVSTVDTLILEASDAYARDDVRSARRALREARRASDDPRITIATIGLAGGGDPGLVLRWSEATLAALDAEWSAIGGQHSLAIGLGITGAGLGIGAGFFALAGVFDDGCGLLSSSCVRDPNENWFVGAAISGVVGLSLAVTSVVLLIDAGARSGRWHRAYQSGTAPSAVEVSVSAGTDGGTVVLRGTLP